MLRSPRGGHCPAWIGGGQKGHHLQLPKSSRLDRAPSPEGPAAGSGPGSAHACPSQGWVLHSLRSWTPSPGPSSPLVCNGISTLLLPLETVLLLHACDPRPPHDYCAICERRLSGVGNLLGFFPTIMALSVPVFSVFSTCEIDVYGKKRKKEKTNLIYCIKITILCAPCAPAFGVACRLPLLTPRGLPSPGGGSVHACGSLVCRAVFYLFVVFLKTQ